MAALRKKSDGSAGAALPGALREQIKKYPFIHLLSDGLPRPEIKGKDVIPSIGQALSLATRETDFPRVELPLDLARRYLHRESLVLGANVPRGFVLVTYQNQPLGFMKNLGERANNLYPKPWAIRSL